MQGSNSVFITIKFVSFVDLSLFQDGGCFSAKNFLSIGISYKKDYSEIFYGISFQSVVRVDWFETGIDH